MTLPIELGTARRRREAEAAYIAAANFVAMSFAASNFESVPRNPVPRWMVPGPARALGVVLAHGGVLLTRNERHFRRVRGMTLSSPSARS